MISPPAADDDSIGNILLHLELNINAFSWRNHFPRASCYLITENEIKQASIFDDKHITRHPCVHNCTTAPCSFMKEQLLPLTTLNWSSCRTLIYDYRKVWKREIKRCMSLQIRWWLNFCFRHFLIIIRKGGREKSVDEDSSFKSDWQDWVFLFFILSLLKITTKNASYVELQSV